MWRHRRDDQDGEGHYSDGEDDDLDQDEDHQYGRPWIHGGPHRVRLLDDENVFIDRRELDMIKDHNINNPKKMVVALMKGIIGIENLKTMTVTGKGHNRTAIPRNVYRVVKSEKTAIYYN